MKLLKEVIVPGYEARTVEVKKGQFLKIIDLEGKQVGDLLCFRDSDRSEYVTPAHTRCSLKKLVLKVGDSLYTNRRVPLMTIVEDVVGRHDILYTECDIYRFKVDFGIEEYHPNCYDNLMEAIKEYDITPEVLPEPINIFQNAPVTPDGRIEIEEPLSNPGDYIILKALDDVIIALSSCSNDVATMKTNGSKVTPLKMEVYDED